MIIRRRPPSVGLALYVCLHGPTGATSLPDAVSRWPPSIVVDATLAPRRSLLPTTIDSGGAGRSGEGVGVGAACTACDCSSNSSSCSSKEWCTNDDDVDNDDHTPSWFVVKPRLAFGLRYNAVIKNLFISGCFLFRSFPFFTFHLFIISLGFLCTRLNCCVLFLLVIAQMRWHLCIKPLLTDLLTYLLTYLLT